MNDTEAVLFATHSLGAWNITSCTPRLISNRENAVFEVTLPNAARAALRLHRPGYQSDASIRSELSWSDALAKAGMRLPQPIAAQNGELAVFVPEARRMASMVSWINGDPLGAGGEDFIWNKSKQNSLYSALGGALAQLHALSDNMDLPPDFTRPCLDTNGLLGPTPLWGRFWENPALTGAEANLLQKTRTRLTKVLAEHQANGGDFGLIHADALRENVFVEASSVTLIDFDDGAFGYRMYELGVAMSQNWQLENAADLANALLTGYQACRPLPTGASLLLPAFITLRCLASCGWTMLRYAADDPTLIAFAKRAVRAADLYLSGQKLFDN